MQQVDFKQKLAELEATSLVAIMKQSEQTGLHFDVSPYCCLFEKDVAILQSKKWINLRLITFWKNLLQSLLPPLDNGTQILDESELYFQKNHRHKGVKNIILPINHEQTHWLTVLLDLHHKQVRLYNSIPHCHDLAVLKSLINKFLKNSFGLDQYFEYTQVECQRQQNGYDCGVFTCRNIASLYLGKQLNSPDISNYRRRMKLLLIHYARHRQHEWYRQTGLKLLEADLHQQQVNQKQRYGQLQQQQVVLKQKRQIKEKIQRKQIQCQQSQEPDQLKPSLARPQIIEGVKGVFKIDNGKGYKKDASRTTQADRIKLGQKKPRPPFKAKKSLPSRTKQPASIASTIRRR